MKIKINELTEICMSILQKKGLTNEQAQIVYEEYLDAELRGKECHGFNAFLTFKSELIDFDSKPEVLRDEDNLLFIDGKKNFGPIICKKFVPELIKKAKKKHIAMMGIYNMHSYLMPGTYTRLAAENDVVGFLFNYGGAPRVAPNGSLDPILGADTISIGIPSDNFPIVLDMATSVIAAGKIRLAKQLGKDIPNGVAINKNGKPTTNPNEALQGALQTFGGYKGSGLAIIVEILTKIMFNVDIHDKTKVNRGFFFTFFDPSTFQPITEFKASVAKFVSEIKSSRKAEGVAEIFLPGEHSEKLKQENLKEGYLEIDDKIIAGLKAMNE